MVVIVFLVRNCFLHRSIGDHMQPRRSFHRCGGSNADPSCPDSVLMKTNQDFLVIGSRHVFSGILKLRKPQCVMNDLSCENIYSKVWITYAKLLDDSNDL